MTKYVRNDDGGVHSVTDEHFEEVLHETVNGKQYLLHGYEEISEAEAKKAHPQLFGKPDPQIVFTDDELVRAKVRKDTLEKLYAENGS